MRFLDKYYILSFLFLMMSFFSKAQISSGNAFMMGDFVEVGINAGGGFEGAAPPIAGSHARGGSGGMLGFVANPQKNGWATYDGDFFTPGSPENGWGLEFPTGINYHNNANGLNDIPGASITYEKTGDCIVVSWIGNINNVEVNVVYRLNVNDLFYTTAITLTNNSASDLGTMYYYRNLDPDNNQPVSGTYTTTNTIVNQSSGTGCIKSIVSAESSTPWNSYMALGAIGSDFRVTRGGFSNRDASNIWNGTGGLIGTEGSSASADQAISLAYRIPGLPAGESHSFEFVVVLNASDVDNAISSLFNFVNDGVLINSSSAALTCVAEFDTIQVCGTNSTEISLVGDGLDFFTWNWSPSTYLTSTAGATVTIEDGTDITYTITGTPVGSCFSDVLEKSVRVEFKDGPFIDWTNPGSICAADFDLSTLVYEDVNTTPGVKFTFHSDIPVDKDDMSNQLAGLTVGPGDPVYMMAASSANECYHVVEIDLNFGSLAIDNSWATDADCNATNGEVGVTISGADPATVDFEWTNEDGDVVGTTPVVTGIPGGKYFLEIDSKGACGILDLELEVISGDIDPPNVTKVDDVSCFGVCDGEATASATTGAFPFTYSWTSATDVFAGALVNTLCAGDYVVRVTDANGCYADSSVTITEPNEITLDVTGTNMDCNGVCDGTVAAVAAGGSGGITYLWDAGSFVNSANQSNLCAGTYNVRATDTEGCFIDGSYEVTEPDALTLNVTGTNIQCNGVCDGTVLATAGGGTGALSYTWDNGPSRNSANQSDVCAGTYNVEVEDTRGCTIDGSIVITEPTALTLAASGTNLSCFGDCDGTVTSVAGGGTGTLTYSWDSGTSTNSANQIGLCAGTYNLDVTDDNGCLIEETVIITEPTEVVVNVVGSNASCNGVCDGDLVTVASGGIGLLTYLWDNGPSVNSPSQNDVCAGTYNLDVTDENGCLAEATVIITEPDVLTVNVTGTNVLCNAACDGSLTATAAGGTTPYLFAWSGGPTPAVANQTDVCAGNYTVDVTDFNGCSVDATIEITEPDALDLTVSGTNLTCFEVCEGTLSSLVTGGTGAYTYNWDAGPSVNSANQTDVCAGTYNLDVTDDNGCLIEGTVVVTQPTELTLAVSGTDIICHNDCNGSLSAVASGGTGAYTFLWDGGPSVNSANQVDVCPGDYNVQVSDDNGCIVNGNHFIVNPPTLSSLIDAPLDFCANTCTGALSLNVFGGVLPYSYQWTSTNGSSYNTEDLVDVCEGDYDVEITDANGCVITNAEVLQPLSPFADFTGVNFTGCPPVISTLEDLSTTGDGTIIQWDWDFGDGGRSSEQSPSYEFQNSGDYVVELTVTTDLGCSDVATMPVTLDVWEHPEPYFIWTPIQPDYFNAEVDFTDLSTNAVSWEWHIGDEAVETRQNPDHEFEDAGLYDVKLIVESSAGCIDSITQIVEVLDVLTLYVPNAFTPNDDGNNDVFNLKGDGFDQFELFVFNRWGEVIFNTQNIQNKWNGRVNNTGDLVQIDTYVWKINVKDTRGKLHERIGKVTVLK